MSKKLNSWVKIETIAYLKVVSFGFLFSILVANCNSRDNKEENADSGEKVNWLPARLGWDTILFDADPNNQEQVAAEKKRIRIYVRGVLAEYNADNSKDYVVEEFNFQEKSRSPLRYIVTASLKPPARSSDSDDGPGVHLIPPAPHPPGGR